VSRCPVWGNDLIETILGIDPGTIRTGWGLVKLDGSRLTHLAHGTIHTVPRHPQALRLQQIFRELDKVAREHVPQSVSIEKVFMARNAQSALKLGQVRGVALLAAAERNIDVAEYNSVEIKKAVAGYGHASKDQVQHMVASILKLPDLPQEDAADALAAAICHSHQHNYQAHILAAASNKRARAKGLRQ